MLFMITTGWMSTIKPLPPIEALRDYIMLWSAVQNIQLSPHPDKITWKWTVDGSYSVASA